MPALFTSACTGPSRAPANARTESNELTSSSRPWVLGPSLAAASSAFAFEREAITTRQPLATSDCCWLSNSTRRASSCISR